MPSPGVGADGRGGAKGQPAFHRAEAILESIGDEFIALDREWRYLYANERALHQIRRASGLALEAADLLGRNCWELFPQLAGTAFDVELHRALRDQQVVEFEARSPTTGRWVDIRAFPSATGLSLYTRDVSARRAAQEKMLKQTEQQALVAELGRRALAGGGPQLLLDETVRQVAAALDVELTAVAELAPDGGKIVIRAGFGGREDLVGTRLDRVGWDSLLGYATRGEPVIVEDMAGDRRFTAGALALDHRAVSGLAVMIESPGEPFGVLCVQSRRRRVFTASEVSFVQGVANILASAVERSRAQERLLEVRDVERRRIARDLHDEALQDLTYALVLAGGAPAITRPDELVGTLKRVAEQLRVAIFNLRLGGERHTPYRELLEAGVDVRRAMTAELEVEIDAGRSVPADPLGADVVELLRVAGRRREQERDDRLAIESLTPRELEVLRALGAGLDSQAIADRLHISLRTERNHVARILTKLGVHSQLQAVLLALRYGLIDQR
jgi:DNA-binding NarL/FixJ family response regulator